MKKKIGEIYNKPIVIGDKNLMTKNEVHKDEISGGSKEYDDLHTYLYYDDRIISMNGMELPLCSIVASLILNLYSVYPYLNIICKMNNTEDIFGINWGNYIPIEKLTMNSSGIDQEALLLINGVSIPKYVIPEYITAGSGYSNDIDKIHIFELMGTIIAPEFADILKTQPTITREEFFDLLK